MKLKQITLYHVQLPMKFNFKTAKGELKLRDTIILKAENTDGCAGYGECVAFTTPFYTDETFEAAWQALTEQYIPTVLTRDFAHPFEIHHFFENPLPMAMAGLENALLDLYFKEKNENTIRSLFPDDQLNSQVQRGAVIGHMPISQLLAEIEQVAAQGVQRVKLKISPQDGFERTKTAVAHFPQLQFAVDANRSFPLTEWQEIAKFDALNLVCIEEPFAIETLSELTADIKFQIQTPLCFDESVQTLSELTDLAKLPGQSMLNLKIGRLGGLYQTKQAIDFCRAHHIGFWVGSMVESGISKILHVQLSALTDNVMAGDLSDSQHYFDEDLIRPEIAFPQGQMTVPTGARLGVTVNETALSRHTIRKEIFR